jgi:tetratricopeptide (TPR) repeat protein
MRKMSYVRFMGYVLVFLIAAALVSYAWLTRELDLAQQASSRGDLASAMEGYARAERPLQQVPWLAQLLSEEHKQATLNQVAILYRQQKNEDALAKLEEIPTYAPALAESADYLFWMGNVLFRQAAETKDPETSVKTLRSAMSEYQRGLGARPEDWDLKFNYELLRSMLVQPDRDRKSQEQKVKSIIEKMRPADPTQKQMAPEKRG